MPGVRHPREALFAGWFGPVAVAAMYYASLMEHKLSEPRIWDVTSLIVCASVLAHGMTAAPLTRWLGRARARAGERP
jgi:NhaP-type Na+/H+ or K+/H+ antiporter